MNDLSPTPRRLPILLLGLLAAWAMMAGLRPRGLAAEDDRPETPPGRGETRPAAFEPTENYETRRIEGWTVVVNKGLLGGEPELADRTLTQLRIQLHEAARRLHPGPLGKLRGVRIWVEQAEPHFPCMVYHPDPGWLREHGMNPEKARCVEISNARNFLAWTLEQPWMVVHELAHGFHHQFLDGGYDNAEVRSLWERATRDGLYRSVLRINGREERAYAATNPMEYFAEAAEAFFGTNDFYPYVRSELRKHDPEMFDLQAKVWGVP
jgi:hypothetical protein